MAFGDPICNSRSFWMEARAQRVCAKCHQTGPFHAHHVVDKATLRSYGRTGKQAYDTRNALRLCEGLDTNRCHFQFENRRIAVTTTMLMDENILYAVEVLGAYALDYLRREYDDTDPDPRLIEMEYDAA